jgi:DNA repair protein RadC
MTEMHQLPLPGMPPLEYHPRDETNPDAPVVLRELPTSELPLARLRCQGPGALATAELREIVTGSRQGLGRLLLATFHTLEGLCKATLQELQQVPGIGPARAAQIKAALELGKRLMTASPEDRPQVKSPADAAKLLMPEMGLLEQEHLRVVLLDTRNRVLAVPTIYVGSAHTAIARVAEIMGAAVRASAVAMIVAHNHPSGDPSPSPCDVTLTRQIVEAGKLLDIDVLDHLVVSKSRYVSMKERGLGF